MESGNTLLTYSCYIGNEKIVNILLEQGADPNIPYLKTKQTPLHLAIKFGFKKIQNLLIAYGADENLKDKNG